MIVKLAFFVLLLVVALGLVGRALPRRKGPAPRPIQAIAPPPSKLLNPNLITRTQ